ncbi:MAG TPA: hypothetical protein VLL95_01435, partial [Phnomibacter sp.]|nr:hypothetical protein [Phnomibacter sp.]
MQTPGRKYEVRREMALDGTRARRILCGFPSCFLRKKVTMQKTTAKSLTKAEEQVMHALWQIGEGFLK